MERACLRPGHESGVHGLRGLVHDGGLKPEAAAKNAAAGQPWTGGQEPHIFGNLDPPERFGGWLSAIDADSGEVRWRMRTPGARPFGVTPTAGGLVFFGDLAGNVLRAR